MLSLFRNLLLLVFPLCLGACHAQQQTAYKPTVMYTSAGLSITRITENTFVHTSYKQTNDFGNVPCNGLVVRNGNETIVFDTPTNDQSAEELISWISDSLHAKINAVIPTHFHDDCLGGLNAFHKHHIPSYANAKTIELSTETKVPVIPLHPFRDSLILKIGNKNVVTRFFGEGHTRDNVVGYFPSEQVLFGGCLLKETGASKGYLGDANLGAWSATVENLKNAYPGIKIVVPGHGLYGGRELLDYTIRLFKVE